jgi:hypothetical protein
VLVQLFVSCRNSCVNRIISSCLKVSMLSMWYIYISKGISSTVWISALEEDRKAMTSDLKGWLLQKCQTRNKLFDAFHLWSFVKCLKIHGIVYKEMWLHESWAVITWVMGRRRVVITWVMGRRRVVITWVMGRRRVVITWVMGGRTRWM